MKSLYRARKIKSKLEQRKLLVIVTPYHLVDINAIKKGRKSEYYTDCKFCGKSHDKGICPTYGKTCNRCGGKNHFEAKCTQKSQNKKGNSRNFDKCRHCGAKFMSFHEVECDCEDQPNNMEGLTEQVQSLFYQ